MWFTIPDFLVVLRYIFKNLLLVHLNKGHTFLFHEAIWIYMWIYILISPDASSPSYNLSTKYIFAKAFIICYTILTSIVLIHHFCQQWYIYVHNLTVSLCSRSTWTASIQTQHVTLFWCANVVSWPTLPSFQAQQVCTQAFTSQLTCITAPPTYSIKTSCAYSKHKCRCFTICLAWVRDQITNSAVADHNCSLP